MCMERKGTGKLRVINDQKVFDYFINEEIGTKKEIAQKTNVSIMTTGTILNDFLLKGIILFLENILLTKCLNYEKIIFVGHDCIGINGYECSNC